MGVGQSARFDRDGGVILQRRARSGGSGSSGAGKTCEGIGRRRARVGNASCGVHAEAAPRCSWKMRLESDVSGRLARHRSGLRAGALCSSAGATRALASGRDDGADRVCVRAILDFHGGGTPRQALSQGCRDVAGTRARPPQRHVTASTYHPARAPISPDWSSSPHRDRDAGTVMASSTPSRAVSRSVSSTSLPPRRPSPVAVDLSPAEKEPWSIWLRAPPAWLAMSCVAPPVGPHSTTTPPPPPP
jgi:hypothetical protein